MSTDRGDVRGTIGAVNTVLRAEDGALIGTNTDAGGFYAPLAELDLDGAAGRGDRRRRRGARGAVRARRRLGVGPVTILNRNRAEGGGAARAPSG